MKTFLIPLAVFAVLLSESSLASEMCYGEAGCFNNDAPFNLLPVPQDPYNKIPPTYFLHRKGQAVQRITNSNNLGSDVIVLAHGFTEDYSASTWANDMITKLHEVRPSADIIFVDWKKGAAMGTGRTVYTQAAANTRSIGAAIAVFLDANAKLDTSQYYCIGFSLGSHVCGFAGKKLRRKWGRITALDPAAPGFFEKNDLTARVATTDAEFLDVVHTSVTGLHFAIGHIDFWVNGGKEQPGCEGDEEASLSLTDVSQFFGCNHVRAPPLFTETINPATGCTFTFCPCAVLNADLGLCRTSCLTKSSQQLGYKAYLSSNLGEYYGLTSSAAPFCLQS